MRNVFNNVSGIAVRFSDGNNLVSRDFKREKDKISIDADRAEISVEFTENTALMSAKTHDGCKIDELGILFSFDTAEFDKLFECGTFSSGIKKTERGLSGKSLDFFGLYGEDGCGLTFAANVPAKFTREFRYAVGAAVEVEFVTEFPRSYEGDYVGEKLLAFSGEPFAALKKAVDGFPKCDYGKEVVKGWSSWDYYFTSVDEAAVRENVDEICADETLKQNIRYVSIDDGWQQREGDWKAGARFPHGLKYTTDYIKKHGFEAGIWCTPIRLHYLSGTVMRRNDFLLRDDLGDPIVCDNDMYILDPTHPDGEKFIRETYEYLLGEGFTFFKVDFIGDLFKGRYFYDKTAGNYDVIRKLFAIIRDVVGEKNHIMGCGYPFGGGAGYVDSRRTGMDIHNHYGHLVKAAEMALPYSASQFVTDRNDLDFLVVRGGETSTESETNVLNPAKNRQRAANRKGFVWRGGADFTYNEAKCWCALLVANASSVILSDRLAMLNERGKELVRIALEKSDGNQAFPVDFTAFPVPAVWKTSNGDRVFAFNWSERTAEFELCAKGEYVDMFTGESFVLSDAAKVTVGAHDCLALERK